MNTININGITYVPVEELDKTISAVDLNGMPYKIVRTYSASATAAVTATTTAAATANDKNQKG